jgi:hypothetical protein
LFAERLRRLRGRGREKADAAVAEPEWRPDLSHVDPAARPWVEKVLPQAAVLPPEDRELVVRALPYTMTGVPRLHALVLAVRYAVRREIPGAFVECGVWQGGSVMAMLLTLQELGVADRDIYLYDTFTGMTPPTEADTSALHQPATEIWDASDGEPWPEFFSAEKFNEEAVRERLLAVGYPAERLHFVRGPVEDTLPGTLPDRIAVLRLDTDWYESTKHELVHLYPRLEPGGVLIVDDYGEWDGARKAVDEYFASDAPPVLLSPVDRSGRVAIKH